MPTVSAKVMLLGWTTRRARPMDSVRPRTTAQANRTDLPKVRRKDSEKVSRSG
jgi:hypothetical protein